jgi:hypothetical protein
MNTFILINECSLISTYVNIFDDDNLGLLEKGYVIKNDIPEEILRQIDTNDVFYIDNEYIVKTKTTPYEELRKSEYPSITMFADALYWQSKGDNTKMEDYLSLVEIVKNTYPKS